MVTENAEIIDRDKILEVAFAFFSRYDIETTGMYLTQLKIFLQHNHDPEKFGDFDKVKVLKFTDDLADCISLLGG